MSFCIFCVFVTDFHSAPLGKKELRTRCCPERPQMTLKHFPWVYYMNICHVGPPWGHSGTHGGPKWPKTALKWSRMAQNHHNGSKWHCMIPNGPNDPKTLPMCILHDYMSCWTTLDPFQRPTGASKLPEKSPRWPKISPKWLFTTPNVLT